MDVGCKVQAKKSGNSTVINRGREDWEEWVWRRARIPMLDTLLKMPFWNQSWNTGPSQSGEKAQWRDEFADCQHRAGV